MHWLMQLFSRRRRYDDLSISIQEHLQEKIEDLMEDGMPQAQAEQRRGANLAM
jgi:putative ABC transport system permease protein